LHVLMGIWHHQHVKVVDSKTMHMQVSTNKL